MSRRNCSVFFFLFPLFFFSFSFFLSLRERGFYGMCIDGWMEGIGVL